MPASEGNLKGMAACYIHPFGTGILILPSGTPDKINVGGVELSVPEEGKEVYPVEGEVLEVGPDVPLVVKIGPDGLPEKDEQGQDVMETPVQPGDRVVYSRYAGSMLNFGDGQKLIVVPFGDLIGWLDKDCPVLQKPEKAKFTPR